MYIYEMNFTSSLAYDKAEAEYLKLPNIYARLVCGADMHFS